MENFTDKPNQSFCLIFNIFYIVNISAKMWALSKWQIENLKHMFKKSSKEYLYMKFERLKRFDVKDLSDPSNGEIWTWYWVFNIQSSIIEEVHTGEI